MKTFSQSLIKAFLPTMLFACLVVAAQAQQAAGGVQTSGAATTITADQFRLDMNQKQGLFAGGVQLSGRDFKMKCREMQVFFGATNKIEKLIGRGDVEIEQAERTARAAQAVYTVAEDKVILTGSPEILQNKNIISGATITLYRSSNRMEIDGRSRVVLFEDINPPKAKNTP